MERIVLAFSSDTAAEKIKVMLESTGFDVDSTVCHNGAELLRRVSECDEVLIIMGYKLPDMVADEVAENIHDGCRLMSIVKPEHIQDIYSEEIFVIPVPINRRRLIASINVFLGNVPQEKRNKRDSTENKTIERAKLYLMEEYHMTEPQAHRFIQRRSMNTGARLIDTAHSILSSNE